MKSLFAVFSVLLIFLCTGCNKSPQDQIIGKWRAEFDPSGIEFRNDGTWSNLSRHASGKYKFLELNKIQIEIDEPRIYEILVLTKTDLHLKYERTGEVNSFKRIE